MRNYHFNRRIVHLETVKDMPEMSISLLTDGKCFYADLWDGTDNVEKLNADCFDVAIWECREMANMEDCYGL